MIKIKLCNHADYDRIMYLLTIMTQIQIQIGICSFDTANINLVINFLLRRLCFFIVRFFQVYR